MLGVIKKGQKGVSILETLVASAIGLVIISSLVAYYRSSYHFKYYLKLRATQESLASEIASRIQSPNVIYASVLYSANTDLTNCLLGIADGCTSRHTLDNAKPTSFSNLVPFSLVMKQGGNIEIFSDPKEPVYYDAGGKKGCSRDDEKCVFEVQTYFFATCPKRELGANAPNQALDNNIGEQELGGNFAMNTCRYGAQVVHLAYQITPIRQGGSYKPLKFSGVPIARALPPVPSHFSVFSFPVSEIFGAVAFDDCHKGSKITGFNEKGVASCSCIRPYRQKPGVFDRLGRPICVLMKEAELRCGGENPGLFRGPNSDGTARCLSEDQAYTCRSIFIKDKSMPMTSACGPGEWIRGFFRSDCKLHCQFGKDGDVCLAKDGDANRDKNGMAKYRGRTIEKGMICGRQEIVCCKDNEN